jgi:hypothetical protein
MKNGKIIASGSPIFIRTSDGDLEALSEFVLTGSKFAIDSIPSGIYKGEF